MFTVYNEALSKLAAMNPVHTSYHGPKYPFLLCLRQLYILFASLFVSLLADWRINLYVSGLIRW